MNLRPIALCILLAIPKDIPAAQPKIYCGGVSGVADLAVAANSDDFRASGGNIYLHHSGWSDSNRITEAQRQTIINTIWNGREFGIELGYKDGNDNSWPNAYTSNYHSKGIRPKYITCNAFSSDRIPNLAEWEYTIAAYLAKGANCPIYATFEYQNFPGNYTTLANNLVSNRADFKAIIAASGGMTLDVPPAVYFRRLTSTNANIRKYKEWIVDAVQWAQSNGHTVGIIVSPNSSGTSYDEDTRDFVAELTEANALPDFFVVENYTPDDPETYANRVGNEDTAHHQLGCARLMQTTYLPAVEGPAPTYGNGGVPGTGNPWIVSDTQPTRIETENYDQGSNGVTYLDTSAGNSGGAYRTDNVDVQVCTDTGGGFNISHIATGERLQYTLNVTRAATYALNLRVARQTSGTGLLRVLFNDVDKTGSLVVPNTGNWQSYVDLPVTVQLDAGIQVMRIEMLSPNININYLEFTPSVSHTLFSLASDASVKEDLAVVDQASPTTLLGTGGSPTRVDRCTVYVFQLPNLGFVANPFTSSSFTFNYSAKQGTLSNNDLYGLTRRDFDTVEGNDYYGKTTTPDNSNATLIQSDILTNSSGIGLTETSTSGNTALRNYLNSYYDSGAGIGKFIFLRLNTNTAKTGIDRATLTMSDGAGTVPVDTRPRLTYTSAANTPPSISTIANKRISVNSSATVIPFTISDEQTPGTSLELTQASSNTALIPSSGIVFSGSGKNRTVTITPTANQIGSSTLSITVSDGLASNTANFLVTVTATGAETWRLTHFGIATNSGNAADNLDADLDGENNFLEFISGQNPSSKTTFTTSIVPKGSTLEFTYTRSNDAVNDGIVFTVEWSNTLLSNSWSSSGVISQILTDTGTLQTIKSSLPSGSPVKRFVRLHAIRN